MTVFNASVGSTEELVATWFGLLLGSAEGTSRVVIGYGLEGCETVDLMYEVVDHLVGSAMPVVSAGTGGVSGMDAVFFL